MAQDTKTVQAPALQPWENESAVDPVDAVAEAAKELENELRGGDEDETQDAEDEESEESGEESEAESEEESEDEAESEEEGAESEGDGEDFEGDWDKVVRSKRHVIKVDGEEREVTYDELRDGHMRHADYTRKSQQREEERRAEKAANTQVRVQLVDKLRAAEAVLEEISPEKSAQYWDDLRTKDPAKFQQEWPAAQLARERKNALREKRGQEEAAIAEEQVEEYRATVNQEFTALQTKMGWKDEGESRKGLQELWDFASKEFGFSEQEMRQQIDHRLFVMLARAKQFVDQQAEGGEKIKAKLKKTKTLPPGGRKTEKPVIRGGRRVNKKAVARAAKTLEQNGSVSAAAAYFEQLLTDND